MTEGHEELTRSVDLALAAGLVDHAVRALNNLAWMTLLAMRLDKAERRLATAIAYAIEHDLDTYLVSAGSGRRSGSAKAPGIRQRRKSASFCGSRCCRR